MGRAVMSLSLGNSGLMLATLAERTPPGRQGFAFAVMNSAGPVGAFVGPLLGGPIVDRWGFRALMSVDVVLMALVVAALVAGYQDAYRGAGKTPILRMAAESLKVSFQSGRLRTLFLALLFLYGGWM